MPRPALSFAIALVFALPAAAQDETAARAARLEALNTAVQSKIYGFLAENYPAMAAVDYRPGWTPEMREAGLCTIRVYEEQLGPEVLDAMFARIDAFVSRDLSSFDDLTSEMEALGTDVPPEVAEAANEACGLADMEAAQMRESGYLDAFTRIMLIETQP